MGAGRKGWGMGCIDVAAGVVALGLGLGCGAACAAEASAGDVLAGLVHPTPDSALRAFSPDRPLNSLSPFTIDVGRVQVESDIFNVIRSTDQDGRTLTWQALDPTFRIGLAPAFEFDLTTAGLEIDSTSGDPTGAGHRRDVGTGAVTLQARYNVFGNDGGTFALALAPFVSLPSGDPHFGNQRVIGGVVAPLDIKLPSDFTLALQTQVQAMRNGTGPAFASFTNVVNLSHPVPGIRDLTASVEVTSVVNADRATPDTATFETALAYLVTPDTQLDLEGFVGLDRAAPDFQVAGGVAHRF